MRKVTLIFGLLAGVIVSIFLVIIMGLCENGTINFDNSELIGYGGMVIALSMIFFGIKLYRDNYQDGAIKFSKGLQVGLLITLIASLIYAIAGFLSIARNATTRSGPRSGFLSIARNAIMRIRAA